MEKINKFGTKQEVYNGTAEMTKGKLTKDDIVRTEDSSGNFRFKSKNQQNSKNSAREAWTKAMVKARKELIAEKKLPKGVFVPIGGQSKEGKMLLTRIRKHYDLLMK